MEEEIVKENRIKLELKIILESVASIGNQDSGAERYQNMMVERIINLFKQSNKI